ncbi:MAG: hypothetical protein EA344_11115 [Alkalicoccus sp.]|nr:MAG: hypothetical protein EA344_11115 [Alkalicoccus sp.]
MKGFHKSQLKTSSRGSVRLRRKTCPLFVFSNLFYYVIHTYFNTPFITVLIIHEIRVLRLFNFITGSTNPSQKSVVVLSFYRREIKCITTKRGIFE